MRLIDADSLIKLLQNNMTNDIQDIIITENNINLIRSIPTAYDPEKVVAEIRSVNNICSECKHKNCESCTINKIIEIVRKGGV